MRYSRDALLRSRFHAPSSSSSSSSPSSPSVRTVAMPGHTGPVYSTSLSRCGQYVLSGGQDGGVRLWSTRRAQPIVAYANHGFPVWDVRRSPRATHQATNPVPRIT